MAALVRSDITFLASLAKSAAVFLRDTLNSLSLSLIFALADLACLRLLQRKILLHS